MPSKFQTTISLVLFLALLGGCSSGLPRLGGDAVDFSAADQERLGARAEPYVLQLLGGPYPDPALQRELERAGQALSRATPCRLQLADHSRPGLYLLPGDRAIVTRGLLTALQSRQRLILLLEQALNRTAGSALAGQAGYGLVAAARAVIEHPDQPAALSPAFPPVVLARALVERGSPVELPVAVPADERPAEWPGLDASRSGYALLAKAEQLEAQGEIRPAISLYLEAGAAAPEEAAVLAGLGLAYLRAGDLQSARMHLEKAVEIQPNYFRTRMGLSYLAMRAGRHQQALAELQESVRLLPTVENLYLLAESHAERGEMDRARAVCEQIVAAGGSDKLVDAARQSLKEWSTDR